MTINLALIPGDGIGPEVMETVLPILDWTQEQGADFNWERFPLGADHFLATGETLSDASFLHIAHDFDAILFGAVGDPRIPDHRHAEDLLLGLRKRLVLNLNHRPCRPRHERLFPLKTSYQRIDMEVFRENTEGPYCLKGETQTKQAVDWAIHSPERVRSLLEAAFLRAKARKCRLTMAHKANVLKHGHGLWMREFKAMQAEFPQVEAESMHADALLCRLIQDPERFGVIAADNFLGDLISDLTAAFLGGLGMAPSANVALKAPFRCRALFEPVHGSAPDLTGKNHANPMGMILSLALLLSFFGYTTLATALEQAIQHCIEKEACTPDVGGTLGTRETGLEILRELRVISASGFSG